MYLGAELHPVFLAKYIDKLLYNKGDSNDSIPHS